MIFLEANNWYEGWLAIQKEYANDPFGVIDQKASVRAVSFDNLLDLKSNELGPLTHTMVGYSNMKLNSFDKKYVIPGKKEEVGQLLVDRRKSDRGLTVLSYPFNIDNKSHSQGPCVLNINIVMSKIAGQWTIRYTVNMRIAEVTKRLLVDFIKFHEHIDYWNKLVEPLGVKCVQVEFYSVALYAQPLWALIGHKLFPELIQYDQDHWFHKLVRKENDTLHTSTSKHKMANRVRKYVKTIK